MDYEALSDRIAALTAGETDVVALMATVVCEVHHTDSRFDWTGFYRVVEPELMKIGPYQGGHGCLVIPFDRGVCGAAARPTEITSQGRATSGRRRAGRIGFACSAGSRRIGGSPERRVRRSTR